MLHDAGLSFFHFTFAFVLAGALSAEAFVLRLPVDARVARLLLRIDLFYGVSAVGLILVGMSRVLWGAKGWEYYSAQPFFWIKIAAFALIGLISIMPTLAYFRWVKAASAAPTSIVAETDVKNVRRWVVAEVHLLVLVLAFAALMARGFGS